MSPQGQRSRAFERPGDWYSPCSNSRSRLLPDIAKHRGVDRPRICEAGGTRPRGERPMCSCFSDLIVKLQGFVAPNKEFLRYDAALFVKGWLWICDFRFLPKVRNLLFGWALTSGSLLDPCKLLGEG